MICRPAFDAVVLAGGQARRLGGLVKAEITLAGRPMIEYVLDGVADARRVVIVGPPQLAQPAKPGRPAVSAVLEDPPYGGPVAGLAAGLAAIPKPERAPLIALLACDAPRAGRAIPSLLKALERVPDSDGARLVDADGNRQNLLAVYRAASLRGAVASADRRGDVRGMSMRALVAHLRLLDVPDYDGLGFDADTWEAVEVLDRDFREEDR